jgi:hypothetical protein
MMNKNIKIISQLISFSLMVCVTTMLHAATPLFQLTPLTPTTLSLPANVTATIRYNVTNNTHITRTLTIQPITATTQATAGPGTCPSPFTLAPKQSCVLTLLVDATVLAKSGTSITKGPIVCKTQDSSNNNPDPFLCSQPSQAHSLNISVPDKAAAFSITPSSGTTSGNAQITITGKGLTGTTSVTLGATTATNLHVISDEMLTAVTPQHVSGLVSVMITNADGRVSVLTNSYDYIASSIGQISGGGKIGCMQGAPLGNLIAAVADESSSSIWGNRLVATGATDNNDGKTNTTTILATPGASPPSAALICASYQVDSGGNTPCQAGNACYNDWFLPAIGTLQLGCLQVNKTAIGGFNSINYWSSTEHSITTAAYYLDFINGASNVADKSTLYAVRCVRNFTPFP